MLRRLFVACTVVVAVAVVGAPNAGAHTEVQRATPGPGAEIGGPVDLVELEFLDPVQPAITIEVDGPDGIPVAGLETAYLEAEGRVARVRFDPLTAIGSYVVSYDYHALDGARQRGSHSFRFTGGGPDAAVGLDDPSDPGSAGLVGLVAFVVVAVAAGVAARVRRAARREDPIAEGPDHGR